MFGVRPRGSGWITARQREPPTFAADGGYSSSESDALLFQSGCIQHAVNCARPRRLKSAEREFIEPMYSFLRQDLK
jgi:hypothetical protein